MRRREFIASAGAVAAWPFISHAQLASPMRRIGVMMTNAQADSEGQTRLAVFQEAMEKLAWIGGRNVAYEYRWGTGDAVSAQNAAAELAALAPDVILANGSPAVAAAQSATRNIPLVFVVVTDPVGAGFVTNVARPGGNTTGFSTFEPEIGSKWVELLKEIDPRLRRVAGVLDPDFKSFAAVWKAIELSGLKWGAETTSLVFREPNDDVEAATAVFSSAPGGGLIVFPTAVNNATRRRLFAMAARHRLPAIYPFRHYAVDGGLVAYGFDPSDLFRRSASYVDRILKGESPGALPVQAPTKFELVINLKTAKVLNLEVPPTLLARADEVIE